VNLDAIPIAKLVIMVNAKQPAIQTNVWPVKMVLVNIDVTAVVRLAKTVHVYHPAIAHNVYIV
jgi:hypothetical protein